MSLQQTLEEFVANWNKWPTSQYVKFPGFKSLYVRRGDILHIDGVRANKVLQIANVTAIKPRSGAFTRLMSWCKKNGFNVYVECVQSSEFGDALERMGFKRVNKETGFHYYISWEEEK